MDEFPKRDCFSVILKPLAGLSYCVLYLNKNLSLYFMLKYSLCYVNILISSLYLFLFNLFFKAIIHMYILPTRFQYAVMALCLEFLYILGVQRLCAEQLQCLKIL